jgi:hypothetical protein
VTRNAVRQRLKSAYIPPQHGAWAFLGLPLVLGGLASPWTPLLLFLGIAWIAAYPLSYAALGLVRAKRPQRFRRPFLLWLAIVTPAVAVLVWWRPWLLWVGAAYSALFAVNVHYARRNDERALANDAVFVIECTAMVVVTWAVATGQKSLRPPDLAEMPTEVWVLVGVCALVLLGSTLHVKSLIRERRDPRFARASRVFATLSVPMSILLATWWGWPQGAWLVAPFVFLGVRAFVVGRAPTRPGVIGMVELAGFLLVVVSVMLASV